MFLLGVESGGFQMSLLEIAGDFGLSGIENGTLVAAQYSAIIMMPFLFGIVAERVGKIRILHIFCLVFSAGCTVVIFTHSYLVLVLGIFIIGSGYSVCESLVSAVLTEQYQDRAGRYLNLVQGAFSLGAVIGPHMITWAKVMGAGWNILFLICGAGFFAVWIGMFFVKEKNDKGEDAKRKHSKDAAYIRRRQHETETRFPAIFFLLVVSFFLYGGMEVGVSYYIDSYMQLELKGASLSAWAVSLFWLSMVPARLASGALYRYRKILLPVCFILSAPVFLGIAFTENPQIGLILFAFLGLLLGTLWPNLMGMATEDNRERAALAAGIMSTGCGLGAVLFPLLFGSLTESVGLRKGFLLLAACSIIGGILCIRYESLKRRRNQ